MIRNACIAALLLADALAVYTVAEWFASGYSTGQTHAPGAWSFVLVVGAGFAVPDLVAGLAGESRQARAAVVAAGVVLIYLLIRIEVAHDAALWRLGWIGSLLSDTDTALENGRYELIAGVLFSVAWLLGTVRARDEIELELVTRSVAAPFGVVTFVVLAGVLTDRSGEVARAAIAFYGVEIVALACSQLALSGATLGQIRGGGVVGALLGATAAGVAVLLVVLSLGVLYLGPILGPPIEAVLTLALTIVLTPIAWVISALFSALFGHVRPPEPLQLPTTTIDDAHRNQAASGHSSWYDVGVFAFRIAAILLTGTVAVALAWAAMRFRRKRSRTASDLEPTGAGALGDDLRELLRSMFRGGSRTGRRQADGVARLYFEVLERAERDARPRGPAETPAEFAPVLSTAFRAEVTDEITWAFEQARYAGREPDAQALRELNARWRAVR